MVAVAATLILAEDADLIFFFLRPVFDTDFLFVGVDVLTVSVCVCIASLVMVLPMLDSSYET